MHYSFRHSLESKLFSSIAFLIEMPHLGSASFEERPSSPELFPVRLSRTFSDSSSQLRPRSKYVSVPRLRESSNASDVFWTGLPSPPPSDDDESNSPKRPFSFDDSAIDVHSPPNSESGDLLSLSHECRQDDVFSSYSISHFDAEDESFADLRRSKKSDSLPVPTQSTVHPKFGPNGAFSDWKAANLNRRSLSTGNYLTPVTPDRYIADRDASQSPFDTFRLSKSPHKLSVIEKLLRQKSATPDPFAPLSPARAQGRALPSLDIRNGNRVRPPGTSGTNVLGIPRDGPSIESRAASIGAVWNVGGNTTTTSPGPVQGISDGRGGLLGSGTNAPMYTSNFLEGRLNEHDDDCFEGRLAAALDIDQTRRMFNPSQSPEYGRRASSNPDRTKRKLPYCESRTRWIDGEWRTDGSPLRE